MVYVENQCYVGYWYFWYYGQGGGQGDEVGVGDVGSVFGVEYCYQQQGDLVVQGQFGVGCLGNEQCGQGYVDVGVVQVE